LKNYQNIKDSIEIIMLPEVELDVKLLTSLKTHELEESQVIVHAHMKIKEPPVRIRIWPNTFLIPNEEGSDAKLIQAIGISFAPEWQLFLNRNHVFTLIFEGLPKDCQTFDLVEDIPLPQSFIHFGINRNRTDVYHLAMCG
jgi:hypothetical protein